MNKIKFCCYFNDCQVHPQLIAFERFYFVLKKKIKQRKKKFRKAFFACANECSLCQVQDGLGHSQIENKLKMNRTQWFDREFPPQRDKGVFPCILERLDGTTARLKEKIASIDGESKVAAAGKWSVKKEIGHLIDLEPLWLARTLQILDNQKDLQKTDLANTKTHETDHDASSFEDLIQAFKQHRTELMRVLANVTEADLDKAAVHPRLGTPMKIIDLAYFVAEHDDHHLAQIRVLMKSI